MPKNGRNNAASDSTHRNDNWLQTIINNWTWKMSVICLIPIIEIIVLTVLAFIILKQHSGAVVANGETCAYTGRQMLKEGGTAVDAAIAAIFCDGVSMLHNSGLGGGFVATVYMKGQVETLDATEWAPEKAEDIDIHERGALSIAVPGELLGLWELHKRYGKLKWSRLVEPAIDLCEDGVPLMPGFKDALLQHESVLRDNPFLQDLYTEREVKFTGDLFRLPRLADTLRTIAKDGPNAFYNGAIGKAIAKDIQDAGGIITARDFEEYQVAWKETIRVRLKPGVSLYTSSLPTGGPILALILNALNKFDVKKDEFQVFHNMVELFKHSYGLSTNLGDVDMEKSRYASKLISDTFKKMVSTDFADTLMKRIPKYYTSTDLKDYGITIPVGEPTNLTTEPENFLKNSNNIAVLSTNGDAVVISSSLNMDFGSMFWSKSTGILLNNKLATFAYKNTVFGSNDELNLQNGLTNYPKPKKRAKTALCPSIVLKDSIAQVRLVIGGSGGYNVPTAIAQVT